MAHGAAEDAARAADSGAYVRRTYAHFARVGVPLDGAVDGVEHTRHRHPPPAWDAPPRPRAPLTADARAADLAACARLDRYGFFDTGGSTAGPRTADARAVVLPAWALSGKRRWPRRRSRPHHTLSPAAVHEAHAARERRLHAKEVQRQMKWSVVDLPGGRALSPAAAELLRRRVYKGVPDAWRGRVWRGALGVGWEHGARPRSEHGAARGGAGVPDGGEGGAVDPRADAPQQPPPPLDALATVPSAHDVQIDLDVPRTIRGHRLFCTRYGEGQCALFALLHAASVQFPACGYCQGMGSLAAVLLMYMTPPEAHAALTYMLAEYGYVCVYAHGFPGLYEDFAVLTALLGELAPEAAAYMASEGLEPSAYATPWLMTIFSSVLPFHTQLRVWDALLLDGRDVPILVAVALVRALYAQRHTTPPPPDWFLESLSAPLLVEEDDALLSWVQRAMDSPRVRSCIDAARGRAVRGG
ncbi:hypothetical protein MSPP1_003001 [Malassezia sp. CBS 17886]|nr:hypothetical protein MSPP1_003001 [Malassezia sp. CBS 17886]